MTESQIQKDIVDYFTAQGALVFRLNAGGGGYSVKRPPPGTPDLHIVKLPVSIWVEVKSSDGKVSKVQKEMHDKLRARGQRVIVARSLDDVIKEMK